jgi:hypothetical protein
MAEQRTTEDLRNTLMNAIEMVESGEMEDKTARTIATLADKVINTAKLELEYSLTVSRLDKDDQGISTGPLLLTRKQEN